MHSITYVGLDVHKKRIWVAIAYDDREGAKAFAEIPNDPFSVKKLVKKLEKTSRELLFCYEAGPCGYELYRQIKNLGHFCIVAAPSLIPQRPGNKVKTDRRDAVSLAHWLRAGELTPVWVPDEEHEALRELLRAREMAKRDLQKQRQRIGKMLLRHGLHCSHRNWSAGHIAWLRGLKLEHSSQQMVLSELIHAMDECQERLNRLEKEAKHLCKNSSLGPIIQVLQALRGIAFVTAAGIVAEAGDLARFKTAAQLMSYGGVTPSEHSSGERKRRGHMTKAGNSHLRFLVIEAAWHYRHRPAVGKDLRARQQHVSEEVKQLSWNAQQRLHLKYRRMTAQAKPPGVAVTAVARELLGFIWALGQMMSENTDHVA